jgi:GntR family transcriptional regulator, transcriptional repressor for pyruvate dehydrogenase complex
MLWGLGPVQAQATYGIAVDRVKRQIHSGLLLPEEKLPAERQLSDEFGISRVTLREALRVLETDSYIVVRRGVHGGAFVTDEDRLNDIARRRLTRAPANAMRVLEFLCANEMAGVVLAAERRSLPELKRMRQALELMAQAQTAPQVKQAETFFHLAMGDATHNPLMARAIGDALSELFLSGPAMELFSLREGTLHRHRALLAALETGDATAASKALSAVHDTDWTRLRMLTRSAA